MRFVKHNQVPAGTSPSGGYSGIPSWRRKWIEEQARKVRLECGCIEDLSIPVITFINTFKGAQIDCVKHGRFVAVVETLKTTSIPAEQSDTPLF